MARASPQIVKILCTTPVQPEHIPYHFTAGKMHLIQSLGSPATHAGPIDRPLDSANLTDRRSTARVAGSRMR